MTLKDKREQERRETTNPSFDDTRSIHIIHCHSPIIQRDTDERIGLANREAEEMEVTVEREDRGAHVLGEELSRTIEKAQRMLRMSQT